MAISKTSLSVLFFIFQYGITHAQFHSNTLAPNNSIVTPTGAYSLYKPVNITAFSFSNKLFYDYLNNPNVYLQNSPAYTKTKDTITSTLKRQTNTKEDISDLPVNDKILADLRNHPFEKRNSWDNPSGAESMENAIFSGSFDFILDLFLK